MHVLHIGNLASILMVTWASLRETPNDRHMCNPNTFRSKNFLNFASKRCYEYAKKLCILYILTQYLKANISSDFVIYIIHDIEPHSVIIITNNMLFNYSFYYLVYSFSGGQINCYLYLARISATEYNQLSLRNFLYSVIL